MRKRSGLSRTQFLVQWVALPVLVIVSAAMFVGLVRNQVSIAAKQQELQSLKNQLAAQVTENAELSGTLDQGEDATLSATPGSRATPSPMSASLWTSAANNIVSAGKLCGSPL